ncbi:Kiwa anti-phage protein KwaB-like domain-containing protein [Cytobacillus sp. BC1816]|uniref:Kiwa anti-phage protein KwaB-like domain-containing protein n=1 Tax=Cytobacillus sp. BC1816 TaxID=3440154 RepID=UPI003F50E7A0
MSINDSAHLVNKILRMNIEEYSSLDVNIYMVCKDKQKSELYFSKKIEAEPELVDFIKENIVNYLKEIRIGEDFSFPIQEYNKEFQLTDHIGVFNIKEHGQSNKAVKNIDLLKKSFIHDSLEKLSKTKFQIISIALGKEKVDFCFYKGIKKNAKTKKLAMFSSNEFKTIKQEIIEFGGKFSFFMDAGNVYIIDPKYFEFAFDYTDHISEISKQNIEKITSMSFFPDEMTKEYFKKASSHQLLARGLANIKPGTIENVEKHFNDRVEELRQIKSKRDQIKDGKEKEAFIKGIGELDKLIKFIDFNNKTVIFDDEEDPKPLLHFFQDKIVTSFLTKEIRVMMAV